MIVLDSHSLAHGLRPIPNPPRFIVPAALKQLCVQMGQILSARNRYPVVPAEVSGFTLHTAFLMTFTGCAKLRLKFPMRSKCNESIGFFSTVSPQDLLTALPRLSYRNTRNTPEK